MVDGVEGFVVTATGEGGGERAFVAAGEADEALRVLGKFVLEDCAFIFLVAQLHAGEELGEILVAGAVGDQEGKAEGVFTTETPFDCAQGRFRHGGRRF